MTKQSNKVATPKGKQAPNTEKKTTKKVAPKKEVVKEVKVVEEIVIKTESPILEGQISEPKEHIIENMAEIEELPVILTKECLEVELGTADEKATPIYEKEWKETPIQTPLTPSELEEKALEAHYASLGQIDFYNKNIKK